MKSYINNYFLIIFIYIISTISCLSQDEKQFKKADQLFNSGNILSALNEYEKLLALNENNIYTNTQIAKCYLLAGPKTKALKYANNAYKASTNPSNEVLFVMAKSLHITHQFDKAISFYTKSDPGNTNKREISKYIQECQYGKKYLSKPVNAKITNAGPFVNTPNHEYLPYITADRGKLFFTSRRPGSVGGKKAPDGMYMEDIYMCYNKGGAWDKPINISSLNTEGHDACIGVSEDGQTMFYYSGTNGGDIYQSELKGKTWTKPVPMPFNTAGYESTATLSPDGRFCYFVYAPTPQGNRDIFMASRTFGGNWSKPKKLAVINTPYDEDCPFVHPDGKTLYFSSKGHSSMGGYDIFKCTILSNGTVSAPVNLGYPINTAGDEVYFVLSADGLIGFYASDKEGGYGLQDIYSIRMPPSSKPQLELFKGTVKDANNRPIEAKITIKDNNTKQTIGETNSNSDDGSYLIALPCGKNYGVAIEKKGYLFQSENINLPCKGYQEVNKTIKLASARSGSKVILNNIFFDIGQATLRQESTNELDVLAKTLKENPTIKIEVSGHTDNVGDANANLQLSEQRAIAVKNYLISKGIPSNRITSKGYGDKQPIAPNTTETGKQKNRRTEFKIL